MTSNVIKILLILVKSIPLPPESLLIIPLNISVVALPKILGPIIENAVLPIANNITKITENLYLNK